MITPERVLDRMCDAILREDTIAFMDDVQLFWGKDWDLSTLSDPCDIDSLRYALKACFVERMVEVWRDPPKNQPTKTPAWCAKVPASEKKFSVVPDEYMAYFEGDLVSPVFGKRNVFAPRDFMFFV